MIKARTKNNPPNKDKPMVSHHEIVRVRYRRIQIMSTEPKVLVICQVARPKLGLVVRNQFFPLCYRFVSQIFCIFIIHPMIITTTWMDLSKVRYPSRKFANVLFFWLFYQSFHRSVRKTEFGLPIPVVSTSFRIDKGTWPCWLM